MYHPCRGLVEPGSIVCVAVGATRDHRPEETPMAKTVRLYAKFAVSVLSTAVFTQNM